MTERDSFLEAIRRAPDDDAPRLVFADWLDENGETDRAALIRFQCALGPRVGVNPTEFDHAVARRLGLPSLEWAEGFDRGFVGGVFQPPLSSEAQILSLLRSEPINRVRLHGSERMPLFVASAGELLRGVRTLVLLGDQFGRVGEMGPLSQCHRLELHPNYLADHIEAGAFPVAEELSTSDLPRPKPNEPRGRAGGR